MTAFVLGNGVSRESISVAELVQRGAVYGCNLLYLEPGIRVIVATDRAIADRIQDTGYARANRFYTRRPRPDTGALAVPRDYHGFSSGPTAVALALEDHCDPIYLLGFDMGPDALGQFNNVYAGQEFYKAQGSTPTYVGNWCRQLIEIMGRNPGRRFVRVCGETTARLPELDRVKNLEHVSMDQFRSRINM